MHYYILLYIRCHDNEFAWLQRIVHTSEILGKASDTYGPLYLYNHPCIRRSIRECLARTPLHRSAKYIFIYSPSNWHSCLLFVHRETIELDRERAPVSAIKRVRGQLANRRNRKNKQNLYVIWFVEKWCQISWKIFCAVVVANNLQGSEEQILRYRYGNCRARRRWWPER